MFWTIMDTLKGQDNEFLSFLQKLYWRDVIVWHNFTNKLKPLDISVNNAAKSFI